MELNSFSGSKLKCVNVGVSNTNITDHQILYGWSQSKKVYYCHLYNILVIKQRMSQNFSTEFCQTHITILLFTIMLL